MHDQCQGRQGYWTMMCRRISFLLFGYQCSISQRVAFLSTELFPGTNAISWILLRSNSMSSSVFRLWGPCCLFWFFILNLAFCNCFKSLGIYMELARLTVRFVYVCLGGFLLISTSIVFAVSAGRIFRIFMCWTSVGNCPIYSTKHHSFRLIGRMLVFEGVSIQVIHLW